jgi:hypothetical protein
MKWEQSKDQSDHRYKWNRNRPVVPFYFNIEDEGWWLDQGWYREDKWFEVSSFVEVMEITGYSNGKGNASIYLRDPDLFSYRVSLNDFFEVLKTKRINGGVIEPTSWEFKKSGSSYLISPKL